MTVFPARIHILKPVCNSLRWALSQQGASGRPRSLCSGWHSSKKSWALIGSVLTSSASEPAAYWLTSRGRWVRS